MQALFEPGAGDGHLEVLEPDLQQRLVGQLGPGKFPTRHRGSNTSKRPDRWCHGRPVATTGKSCRQVVSARRARHPWRAGRFETAQRAKQALSSITWMPLEP